MKGNLMRAPVISELYSQKATYANHIKKLDKIREDRKTQLHNQGRSQQLTNIKEVKSRSFAYKFNERNHEINKSNLKFLDKLEKVKPYHRHTTYASSDRMPAAAPSAPTSAKRKSTDTEKENSRIFYKLKSVSSSLNHDKMMQEYAKTQRIKERIARFTTNQSRVSLKSEQYFSHNRSRVSSQGPAPRTSDAKSLNRSITQQIKAKPSLASHYRKDDIMRNRISTTSDNRWQKAQQAAKSKRGILPELKSQEKDENSKAFFTTEPTRTRRTEVQRKRKR